MSTMTAVAPPLSLLGPVPQEPPHSLLALLRKLGGDFLTEGGRIVDSGVWFSPCALPEAHDPCAAGTFRDKSEGEGAGNIGDFAAFTAYLPMICSAYPAGRDPDAFEDRLRQAFRARESYAVEQELSRGAAISGNSNPYFGDANLTVLAGGSAVSPGVALSYLEEAIAETTAARGIIHATPAVVSAWQALPVGEADLDDAILQTVNGNYIASGAGYIDADPVGGATPGAGESWAFATGLVRVHRGEEVMFDLRESLDRSDNTWVVRAERDYVASFDPCVQAGVLVDWTS